MTSIILAFLVLQQTPQAMTQENAIHYMLRYIPQNEPVVIELVKGTSSLCARPVNGQDWKIQLEFVDEIKLIVSGMVKENPSPKGTEGAQKAIKAVLKENWKLPFGIRFGSDGDWLTYSVFRMPRVSGGVRLIMFNPVTSEFKIVKDH